MQQIGPHRFAAAALLVLFTTTQSGAQSLSSLAEFYKDKKVRMLVGYGIGTGNDLYMRLLARHMSKHIPGQPTIMPENMPGAGSLIMMNLNPEVQEAQFSYSLERTRIFPKFVNCGAVR